LEPECSFVVVQPVGDIL